MANSSDVYVVDDDEAIRKSLSFLRAPRACRRGPSTTPRNSLPRLATSRRAA
jgi:FixJ family two-component response regulator